MVLKLKEIKLGTRLTKAIILTLIILAYIAISGIAECSEIKVSKNKKIFSLAMNRPEDSPYYKWLNLVFSEVFNRMGMVLEMDYYPLKRASSAANSGIVDGEPARIKTYNKSFPNLLQVQEPVILMVVAAYKSNTTIPDLKGWESLKNGDYRIEYPRGMKICENNLLKMIKPDRLTSIKDTAGGLGRLILKRTDLYIDDVNSVTPLLQLTRNKYQGQIQQAGIMTKVPLYMFVHKQNEFLIPDLTRTIKTIKAEGLIEHYHKKAFNLDKN